MYGQWGDYFVIDIITKLVDYYYTLNFQGISLIVGRIPWISFSVIFSTAFVLQHWDLNPVPLTYNAVFYFYTHALCANKKITTKIGFEPSTTLTYPVIHTLGLETIVKAKQTYYAS